MQPSAHLIDYERRFGGVARLYGREGAEAIAKTHFCVVGVGGVGSWAVEALARTDARLITLIDLDQVAESNTNRQIQALGDEYGKAKIAALKDRIALINPRAEVRLVEEFVDEDNVEALIPADAVVLDCIDQVRAKAALIAHCRKLKQFIVTSGAAGGRVDPAQIRTGDLGRITRSATFFRSLSPAQGLRIPQSFARCRPPRQADGAAFSRGVGLFCGAREKTVGGRDLCRHSVVWSCLFRLRLRRGRHGQHGHDVRFHRAQ